MHPELTLHNQHDQRETAKGQGTMNCSSTTNNYIVCCHLLYQRAKKVVSDSPGLVDFAVGLVIFVLNLPDGQVLFWGEIQITEGL